MVMNEKARDEEREPFYWDDRGSEMTFVENMRALRERRGMSQTEFAKRASEQGLSFHQPTVQRIEKGERPLRLTESIVIAEILGSTLEQMMSDVSLPFAYHMLVRSLSWEELDAAFHFILRSRGFKLGIQQIQEHVEDYLRAADAFGAEVRSDVIARANVVLQRLEWAQNALDAAQATLGDLAAELEELPPLPPAAHGGTPWDDDVEVPLFERPPAAYYSCPSGHRQKVTFTVREGVAESVPCAECEQVAVLVESVDG